MPKTKDPAMGKMPVDFRDDPCARMRWQPDNQSQAIIVGIGLMPYMS